jgi:hypothetical protein
VEQANKLKSESLVDERPGLLNAKQHGYPGEVLNSGLANRIEPQGFEVTVEDAGNGIKSEDSARLFTEFAQTGSDAYIVKPIDSRTVGNQIRAAQKEWPVEA